MDEMLLGSLLPNEEDKRIEIRFRFSCGTSPDTSQKFFTPKSLKKPKVEEKSVKKRAALFPDVRNDTQGFPLLKDSSNFDENALRNFSSSPDAKGGGDCLNTPKLRRQPGKSLNESDVHNFSYASPVSPLYSRFNNFHTPKNKKPPNSSQKSSERTVCLGDFIIQKSSSARKKAQKNLIELVEQAAYDDEKSCTRSKKSRRINPTRFNQKKHNENFSKSVNSFNFQSDFVELAVDDVNEQRNLLADERTKIVNDRKLDDAMKVPSNYNFQNVNSKLEIRPDVTLVTFKKELQMLVEIYTYMLNCSITLNVTSELYFLISLLISRQYEDGEKFERNNISESNLITNKFYLRTLFKTIHNSVYFVVNSLISLTNILQMLDRSTIKLIVENDKINQFSVHLSNDLLTLCDSKSERSTEVFENQQLNVCFMSDTDNRENFPTDASFHAFRKQRDMFYEILRIWEQNHFISNWNFALALGGKIRALVNLHNDPVNFRHLARLFKAQLLTTCREYNSEEGVLEYRSSALSSIPNIDANKLGRLKSRLVTKQVSSGLNSIPQFTGHQEFYKEFIVLSTTHVFHTHLRDALVLEVLNLNENKFTSSDLEDAETLVDSATRNSYLSCVKSLRILAKFLGFLEALPYRIDYKVLPEKVLASEIETRWWLQPAFDLKQVITNSIKNRTLVLTIPWLTKYLSMLDYVTLRLPYYESVLELLFYVYSNYPHFTADVSHDSSLFEVNSGSMFNILLVRLCLGWLFELPHFPSELYFNWYSKKSDYVFLSTSDSDVRIENVKQDEFDVDFNSLDISYSEFCENSKLSHNKCVTETSLDDLNIVDQNVLYTCCPYLEEFKKLLASNAVSNGAIVKHITPLSAVESPVDNSEKKLKVQLEEAFFNCQPVSVRKTVEFVSERVASTCVKYICSTIVPDAKKSSLGEFQNIIHSLTRPDDANQYHTLLTTKSRDCAAACLQVLQSKCIREAEKMSSQRIPASIDLLLSSEELVQTKDTCFTIATRMCLERVQQWVNSHINLGIFSKEFDFEVQRSVSSHAERAAKDKPVFMLPPGGRNVPHNPDTLSAVKLVENIRLFSLDILERHSDTIISDVTTILKSTQKSIKERCDINDSILFVINKMLVDVVLLLITHQFEIALNKSVLIRFVEHWKTFGKTTDVLFKTIVCPRNVMLMAQSRNVKKSWDIFTCFVSLLLRNDLLSCEAFESQCITMYHNEWDEVTLKHLSNCCQGVVDDFVRTGGDQSNFTSLLRFMAESCSNMDVT